MKLKLINLIYYFHFLLKKTNCHIFPHKQLVLSID